MTASVGGGSGSKANGSAAFWHMKIFNANGGVAIIRRREQRHVAACAGVQAWRPGAR